MRKNGDSKVKPGGRKGGLEDRKRILQATKALGGGSSKQMGFAGRKNVLESTREDGFVSLPWGL